MSDPSNGYFRDKTILITGICGTVGSDLLRQLLLIDGTKIVGIDNNEEGMFFLHDSYREKNNVNLLLGDLSDRELLLKVCRDVDVIFHAAALKHVILSERSPEISIRTNIVGSQNVIDAARTCGVKSIIFTSSDKAVNPTSGLNHLKHGV